MLPQDSVPDSVARETTDPTPSRLPTDASTALSDESLEIGSKRVGWIWGLAGVAGTLFLLGGASFGMAARLATKEDLTAAFQAHASAHASAPSDPQLVKRLDGLDVWRAAHEAKEDANAQWMREALGRLLDERRLTRPAETLPSPPAVLHAP